MYAVNKIDKKLDNKIIESLSRFGVAMIADSMGRYGAMKPYIRPLKRGMRIAGPALTVQTYRSDNLMLHIGLDMAEEGDVLVVDAGEVENAGLWGGLMTKMALIKKLNGIVTDGAVRDAEEIIESGFAVFSKSISPLGGFKESPGSVNVPISCGGTVVNPGDIIIADDDGIAVIPYAKAEYVLEQCQKTEEKEDRIRSGMEAGQTLFELLGLPEKIEKLNIKLPCRER